MYASTATAYSRRSGVVTPKLIAKPISSEEAAAFAFYSSTREIAQQSLKGVRFEYRGQVST
jgi:hypothetical protein